MTDTGGPVFSRETTSPTWHPGSFHEFDKPYLVLPPSQGTEAWHNDRLGKVTASNLHKVLCRTKTGYGADRGHYMTQLVLERITGQRAESYTNAAMQWGIEQEPFARASYEAKAGVMVDEVGFIQHPSIEASGASPDGLVGDDGLVEIKCPESKTMLEVWLAKSPVEGKYFAQMQWQMACTDRSWCDYVVYDPRMPAKAQLFVTRVNRDDKFIATAETEVRKFLAEVDEKVSALRAIIGE
jgi:putative phage-type endonuclease